MKLSCVVCDVRTFFLSASVPAPDRDPKYHSTADVVAIRDCIKALVSTVVPSGQLVFGGHPAITPLVRLMIQRRKIEVRQHVIVYVSTFYTQDFPPALSKFEEVRTVPAVGDDAEASKAALRKAMIGAFDYAAGIFIGGMDGVEEEYSLFRAAHPKAPTYPIASTGAASSILFKKYQSHEHVLEHELTYPTLFRKLLHAQP